MNTEKRKLPETQRNRDSRIEAEWLERIRENRERWIEKLRVERNTEEERDFHIPIPLGEEIKRAQRKLDNTMEKYDRTWNLWKKEEKRINLFIFIFSVIGISAFLWTSLVFLFSLVGER